MKIKTQFILVTFLLGCLALTGCTTVNTAANAQGSGEKVIYKASFDEVWEVMPAIISGVGLELVSANQEQHVFLAKNGISTWSWGENVAIFVGKVETNRTCVEVITKRKLVTNITAQEWDAPIFTRLDEIYKRD
jgi:hypothetical protein